MGYDQDLKTVYGTVNEYDAYKNLISAKEEWSDKYPNAIKSWVDNLITFFECPDYIRRIVYTINAVESLNSQFRKVTKTKLIFSNNESLMKMLYLATEKVSKKWNRVYANCDLGISQLNILFSEVLNEGA